MKNLLGRKQSPDMSTFTTPIAEYGPSFFNNAFSEEPMMYIDGMMPELQDPFAGTTVVGSPASSAPLFMDDHLGMPLKPPMLPEPTLEVEGLMNRLLAIQTRLARILNCLTSQANGDDDMEDIYRLSEDVISILTSIRGNQLNGVAILLLSSCYVSLIQAFESLANALRKSLQDPDQAFVYEKFQSLSQGVMPYISVGAVRLEMPKTAITEVNLHLIGQTVLKLKAAISECTIGMNVGRSHEEGMSPLSDLTDLAMSEVRRREENLFLHLQTAK